MRISCQVFVQVEFAPREFGSVHEAVYGHALKLLKVQERAPPIHGDADADNVGVRRKAATGSRKTSILEMAPAQQYNGCPRLPFGWRKIQKRMEASQNESMR
mmetsp:Transcript_41379/g.72746  ORF Transcript_41379/g.72746 Transcript_41379/m.72746 type:complete len:102 (-) Transcript_41379:263-568(-)